MYIIVIDHDIDMMQVFSYNSVKDAHTMFNADYMKALDELNDANHYIDQLVEEIRTLKSDLESSNQANTINIDHSMMFSDFMNDMHRHDMGVLKEELNQAIKENKELKTKLNRSEDLYQNATFRLDCAVAQNSELEQELFKARNYVKNDKFDTLVNNSSDIYISHVNGADYKELKVEFEFRDLPMPQWDRVFEVMNEIAKLRYEPNHAKD